MAALDTDTSATAEEMASEILGNGFIINSATYTGANNSSATYTDGNTTNPDVLPSDSGVIFSTGNVDDFANANGANNTSTSTSTDTSGPNNVSQFDTAAGANTYDASYLEVNFTALPGQTTLNIEFRFYSEEYNEYVYSNFNDIALIQIDGVTIPLTVGSGEISVNSINNAGVNNPGNGNQANDPNPGNGVFDSANPNLYIDNTSGSYATEMDGFTVTLSMDIPVTPGVTYTLLIGIADVGDSAWDSSIIIASNTQMIGDDTDPIAVDDLGIETWGANAQTINVLANDTDPNSQTLTITQINGVDVVAGDEVTLATGHTVTLNPSGTVTLVNTGGGTGSGSFSYTITDTDGYTDSAFVGFNSNTICFTPGAMIDTPSGARPVEDLRAGDFVLTRDNGPQKIRWTGMTDYRFDNERASDALQPIRIAKGSLGPDMPNRDILLSPRHQALVKSPDAMLLLGESEVLCAAEHLLHRPGVTREVGCERITYLHLLLDGHEILRANGLCTESLYPGSVALDGLAAKSRDEIFTIFPHLRSDPNLFGPAARYVARKREAQMLVA